MTTRGYPSSDRPVSSLPPPPRGPAPGASKPHRSGWCSPCLPGDNAHEKCLDPRCTCPDHPPVVTPPATLKRGCW